MLDFSPSTLIPSDSFVVFKIRSQIICIDLICMLEAATNIVESPFGFTSSNGFGST
jgi:hypothetical protein